MLDIGSILMNSAVLYLKKEFSLLEEITVVVIVGIFATLAYPILEGYLQRSKQNEAKLSLRAVYTAQKIYSATIKTYVDSLDKLDLELEKGESSSCEITLTGDSSSFTHTVKGDLMIILRLISGRLTRTKIFKI